jgi:hypothetical protein
MSAAGCSQSDSGSDESVPIMDPVTVDTGGKRRADEIVAVLGGQLDPDSARSSHTGCPGADGEYSRTGDPRNLFYVAHVKIDPAQLPAAPERLRSHFMQTGMKITTWRNDTTDGRCRGELRAEDPRDSYRMSAISTSTSPGVSISVASPCYLPPSPVQSVS